MRFALTRAPSSRACIPGLFARAEIVFRRMLMLEEQAGNANGVASATESLGALAAHQKRYDDAAALLSKAIRLWTANGGADDPRVASARATLARVSRLVNGAL